MAGVNAAPNPALPAGKSAVFVSGKHSVAVGETVTKIEASFYTTDKMGNLKFEGSVTDPNFGANTYQTSEFTATNGTAYTIISRLHYKDAKGVDQQPAQGITSLTP